MRVWFTVGHIQRDLRGGLILVVSSAAMDPHRHALLRQIDDVREQEHREALLAWQNGPYADWIKSVASASTPRAPKPTPPAVPTSLREVVLRVAAERQVTVDAIVLAARSGDEGVRVLLGEEVVAALKAVEWPAPPARPAPVVVDQPAPAGEVAPP